MLSFPLVYQLEGNHEQPSAAEIENYLTQQSPISEDEIVNLLEQEDINKLKITNSISKADLEEELYLNTELEKYITN
jgi:hypothetical protein